MAMDRSQMMASVRSKNTQPEMIVRKLAHSMGYRFRIHRADLPGKPDLCFPSRKKVVFVHGCFWHQHGCNQCHLPRSNTGYWLPKLSRNRARDFEHLAALTSLGWKSLVIWECELDNATRLSKVLSKFLGR